MRHKIKGRKLGRTASHRKSTLRALALAIIEHKEIKTTLAKAKEARRHVDKLISYTKNDSVHARRMAYRFLNNHQAVKSLFDEIAPVYSDREGGYTRVIKLGQRIGDGAEIAILQLVGFESMDEVVPVKEKVKKSEPKEDKPPKEDTAKSKEEKVSKGKEEEAVKDMKPEAEIPQEEKAVDEEVKTVDPVEGDSSEENQEESSGDKENSK